ncbi:PRC-barrel domain-containing protein [Natronorarus salvus]|uniref:PRC-barrel domain-containing protein n=1 Tax=Natronorarus salvus TaxID=3117733 RepID=UPI002F25FDC5
MASNPRIHPEDGDEGKDVVSTDGETVGVVSAVEAGTLFVDVDTGIVESVTARLGWGDADGSKPIPDGRIERIDEGEVVIRTTEEVEDEHRDERGSPIDDPTDDGSDAAAGKYADAEPGEQIDDPDPTGMEDPGAGVPGTGDPGRVDPGEEGRPGAMDDRPEAEDGARPEEPGGPGEATDDR